MIWLVITRKYLEIEPIRISHILIDLILLKSIEEDIYGECYYYWLSYDFKEIYNRLDKQEFLKKINALIEEYGNAVITDDISLCVKTDESIRLKDWYDKMSYGNNKQD